MPARWWAPPGHRNLRSTKSAAKPRAKVRSCSRARWYSGSESGPRAADASNSSWRKYGISSAACSSLKRIRSARDWTRGVRSSRQVRGDVGFEFEFHDDALGAQSVSSKLARSSAVARESRRRRPTPRHSLSARQGVFEDAGRCARCSRCGICGRRRCARPSMRLGPGTAR